MEPPKSYCGKFKANIELPKGFALRLHSYMWKLLTFATEYAEADTFWCFNQLMGEIRDNFIKQLDDSHCGIGKALGTVAYVRHCGIRKALWHR